MLDELADELLASLRADSDQRDAGAPTRANHETDDAAELVAAEE